MLSLQAIVLMCIAKQPDVRVRDLAERVGVTERSITRAISDLERSGVVYRVRLGNRNRYLIDLERPLDATMATDQTVGDFVKMVVDPAA